MNGIVTDARAGRAGSWDQLIFSLTLISLGVMGLIKGSFDATWPALPKFVPAPGALAYVSNCVYLLCGAGLLWRASRDAASRVLLTYLLAWLALVSLPQVFLLHPTLLAAWGFGKTAVIVAAAWVLADRFASISGYRGVRIARILYGLALIPFGLAHFVYLEQTTVLIPHWLPFPAALAYFTGAVFVLAGIAIVIGFHARIAAMLSTLEFAVFLFVVWVPRVVAGSVSAFQWGEFLVTWALAAAAWVVTESYRASDFAAPA